MVRDVTLALQMVAAAGAIGVVTWLGVVFTRAARRGGGGMQALESGADPLDPW